MYVFRIHMAVNNIHFTKIEIQIAKYLFKQYIEMGLVFGSSVKTRDFNDIDVLLMYDAEKSRDINKIKDEIRKSGLVEKPIRYVDIAEKDILLNKEDKIFYSILSESLVFHNPEKYVEMVRKCRK